METTKSETSRDRRIREAQTQVIERLSSEPGGGLSTLRLEGHIGEGLTCRVEQNDHRAVIDFGPEMGGDGAGPSPGFFARAAVAGCVAMAVKMRAAREGFRFDAVDVSVEMDFDDLALFDRGTRRAAPLRTRIGIGVTTQEPDAVVDDVVARALEADPYYLALRDPQEVSHEVRVTRPVGAAQS